MPSRPHVRSWNELERRRRSSHSVRSGLSRVFGGAVRVADSHGQHQQTVLLSLYLRWKQSRTTGSYSDVGSYLQMFRRLGRRYLPNGSEHSSGDERIERHTKNGIQENESSRRVYGRRGAGEMVGVHTDATQDPIQDDARPNSDRW